LPSAPNDQALPAESHEVSDLILTRQLAERGLTTYDVERLL